RHCREGTLPGRAWPRPRPCGTERCRSVPGRWTHRHAVPRRADPKAPRGRSHPRAPTRRRRRVIFFSRAHWTPQFFPRLPAKGARGWRIDSANTRNAMFNHVSVGVRSIERAKPFYDATLGALGYKCLSADAGSLGYGKSSVLLWVLKAEAPVPGD